MRRSCVPAVRFYRECEIKHARVAMLASVGFLIAENVHPLFGGEIDVPSYLAFQETPLQTYWKAVLAFIALFELSSLASFYFPLAILWEEGERKTFLRPWLVRECAFRTPAERSVFPALLAFLLSYLTHTRTALTWQHTIRGTSGLIR